MCNCTKRPSTRASAPKRNSSARTTGRGITSTKAASFKNKMRYKSR